MKTVSDLYSLKSVLPDSTVGKALDNYHRVAVVKVKCKDGTYSTAEGLSDQSECIYCPAGKYCNADFDGYADLNSLPNCEAGYYCSGGSSSPTPLQDNILQDCWLTNSCDSSVTETCWENVLILTKWVASVCPDFTVLKEAVAQYHVKPVLHVPILE